MSVSDLETIELEKIDDTKVIDVINTEPIIDMELEKSPLSGNNQNNSFLDLLCRYQFQLLLVNILWIFLGGSTLVFLTLKENVSNKVFWLNQLLKYIFIILIQYGCAYLVIYKNIRVNYSRKIVHISYFIWPQILDKILVGYDKTIYTELWNIWIIYFLLVMMSSFIRKKIEFLDTLFVAVDRPEDRPYTLIWFSSQIFATLLILLPFVYYFNQKGYNDLVFIPILINGLGDGLAEPVGVRFGNNKYKTKGCLTSREYTRSYEGSFCVYIISLMIILSYYGYFSKYQYIFAAIVIPISSTIVEAYAPHTWDSPLIYFSVLLLLVITLEIN